MIHDDRTQPLRTPMLLLLLPLLLIIITVAVIRAKLKRGQRAAGAARYVIKSRASEYLLHAP